VVLSVPLCVPLCEIDKLADFVPVLVGLKATLIVQVAFGASAALQLFVLTKWALSVSVTKASLTVRFVVPVLLIVKT